MSKPISEKKNVKVLLEICQSEELTNVVISPGSRNAPLILSFAATPGFRCMPVVDERSAGYFALGIAQQTQRPVALICTSGTAALNYAPAIAEAYYQNIPLVVITADRPAEWIDQADGQTIRQREIFKNYVKYSCDLPVDIVNSEDEWYTSRLVSEAFIHCKTGLKGPVHINVPLREPLYGRTIHQGKQSRSVMYHETNQQMPENVLLELAQKWNGTERVMLLLGMMNPNEHLNSVLQSLAQSDKVVVLTESLTNCYGDDFVRCIDRVVTSIRDEEAPLFRPDLLITFDGPVLSKMVKTLIRQYAPKEHWHISKGGQMVDTYKSLTRIIKGDGASVLSQLQPHLVEGKSRYRETWLKRAEKVVPLHDEYIKSLPWSDFKVFDLIINHLPQPLVLQLSNSTPVRYAQLFDSYKNIESYSNRGTSGIDGSVSTAVGAALVRKESVLLITGDLSFMYDSNALWNKNLSPNLKIIVINNSGGGIFRFLQGSSETDELEEFFATSHNMTLQWVTQRFGVDYYQCGNENELADYLPQFFEKQCVSVLEIMTPIKNNAKVLKSYFSMLKV